MLVLTMTPGDKGKVMIGDDVEVQILEVRGKQVSVGFSAPPDVAIDRLKVWKKKRERRGGQRA